MQDLVSQLSHGIRLPDPDFCPPPVLCLFKQCFQQDPNIRPDFEQIKNTVEAAYNKVIAAENECRELNENETEYSHLISNVMDNTMKTQYATVMHYNQANGNTREINTERQALNDREIIHYVSLENIESLDPTPKHILVTKFYDREHAIQMKGNFNEKIKAKYR